MSSANKDIKLLAAGKGVRMWQIAKELKISETYFCRIMRDVLPSEKKKQILEIIDRLSKSSEVDQ